MEDPLLATDADIIKSRTSCAGLFLPTATLGANISEGEEVGTVVDPRTGQTIEVLMSTVSGVVIAVRNQPVVTSGELVAQIMFERRMHESKQCIHR